MDLEIDMGAVRPVNIKVIGVGNGGTQIVDGLARTSTPGVEFIAVNTDKPALDASNASRKILIGENVANGRGTGADPEQGRQAVEESREPIAEALKGADLVILTAGMGGGTGTGAAPVVAGLAKEQGILTVGVVSKPFRFEGLRRKRQAQAGLAELLPNVNALFIIPDEQLKLVSEQKLTMLNAFETADGVLQQAIQSIFSSLAQDPGLIDLDFQDVAFVLKDAGYSYMGLGRAAGEHKAEEAAQMAITCPLLEQPLQNAKGLLIHILGAPDISLDEVDTAVQQIMRAVKPETNILFRAAFDDSLDDEMKVILLATGFEEPVEEEPPAEVSPTIAPESDDDTWPESLFRPFDRHEKPNEPETDA